MQTIKHKITLLKGLLYLKNVIDLGQFQKSADKNGIKQPNLSLIISNLEHELKTDLIYKTNAGILPTNSTQQIYENIKEIEELLDRIEATFNNDKDDSGTITLWVGSGLAGIRFLKIVSDFYAKFPKIRLDILTEQNINLSDIDLLFCSNRQNIPTNAVQLLSLNSQINFYSTKQYLDAHGYPKNLDDLFENFDLCFMKNMLKWPELKDCLKHAHHINTTTDVLSALIVLIRSGAGITLLPDWCAKYNYSDLVELKELNFSIPVVVYFMCRQGLERQKRIIELCDVLEQTFFK